MVHLDLQQPQIRRHIRENYRNDNRHPISRPNIGRPHLQSCWTINRRWSGLKNSNWAVDDYFKKTHQGRQQSNRVEHMAFKLGLGRVMHVASRKTGVPNHSRACSGNIADVEVVAAGNSAEVKPAHLGAFCEKFGIRPRRPTRRTC